MDRWKKIVPVLVVIVSGFLLAACQTVPRSFGQRTDVDPQYFIAMGANQAPDFVAGELYPDFSSVVALWDLSEEWVFASGVLVHEQWVLTAAHNVIDLDEYDEIVAATADEITIRFGANASQPGLEVGVAEIFIHPEYERAIREKNHDSLTLLGVDIALLRLDDSVLAVAPARVNFSKLEPLGLRIIGAGYGDYGGVIYHDDEHWSLRTGWENILDRVVPDVPTESGFHGGFIIYDFDSTDGTSTTYGIANTLGTGFESYDEETVELLELAGLGDSDSDPLPFEGTAVPGDSGGPIFARLNGEWHVIAVVAFGSTIGYYGDIGFNSRTASHTRWILDETKGVLAPDRNVE